MLVDPSHLIQHQTSSLKGNMLIWKSKLLILGMEGGEEGHWVVGGFWGGQNFFLISEVQLCTQIQDFGWSFLFKNISFYTSSVPEYKALTALLAHLISSAPQQSTPGPGCSSILILSSSTATVIQAARLSSNPFLILHTWITDPPSGALPAWFFQEVSNNVEFY